MDRHGASEAAVIDRQLPESTSFGDISARWALREGEETYHKGMLPKN